MNHANGWLGLLLAAALLLPPALAHAEDHGGGHGGGHGGEAKPEGAKAPEAPKPKPKKPDKDKNCRWERDVDLEIEGRHITVTQATLRAVMRGGRFEQDGFDLYGSSQAYALRVRDKEGNWYSGSLTRLGDEREGCLFYLVGRLTQLDRVPQLQ